MAVSLETGFRTIPIGKRPSLIDAMPQGARIALREGVPARDGKERTILVHDPRGEIKVGNPNVTIMHEGKEYPVS